MDEAYTLLDYLPIEDLKVNDYVTPLFKSANVTFEKNEYQFSYFALHLIFMTYIYCAVWKIAKFHTNNYHHSLLFARPYQGCKVNFKEVASVFDYSHLPEKDIFEFFSLIDLDNTYIQSTKKLIDTRNEMAHATGKIQIHTREDFDEALKEILSVVKVLHQNMSITIKKWYKKTLLYFAKNDVSDKYATPLDYINEVFITGHGLSQNDFYSCMEFGLSKFKDKEYSLSKEELAKIKEFHMAVNEKYKEIKGEEINYEIGESEALNKLEQILQSVTWDFENKNVYLLQKHHDPDQINFDVSNYSEFYQKLEEIAEYEALLYMPNDDEMRKLYMQDIRYSKIIEEAISPYQEKIEQLGWDDYE